MTYANVSSRFLLLAVACALFGMGVGIAMAISQDFTLAPAHAHLNLLGWVSLALFGLYYRAEPRMVAGKLPQAHFWLALAGVAVMIPALFWRLLGHEEAESAIGLGALLNVASMILFGAVVFRNRGRFALAADEGFATAQPVRVSRRG